MSRPPTVQLLPSEQVTLIINNEKQTTDVTAAVQFSLGKINAKQFFTRPIKLRGQSNIGGLGWCPMKFDSIDWESLCIALNKKPDMYGI